MKEGHGPKKEKEEVEVDGGTIDRNEWELDSSSLDC